jgi:hypothetical protein
MRIEEIRTDLAARLRDRQGEIEQAALTRVYAVSDPSEATAPEYTARLKMVVSAALDHGIEAVERSEDRPPPIPTLLLSQARLAARHGVKLETVLRRYLGGYTLLGDFLIEESERDGLLNGASLKRLLRVQSALLDRLIAAISEEYAREAKVRPGSSEQRRVERIERLLAGDLVDASDLAYDFDANHLGLIAAGPGAAEFLRELASTLDRRLLLVRRGEGTVWAWLGARREADPVEVERALPKTAPAPTTLTIGEPGQGMAGWRLTHQQARAALTIALRTPRGIVRYAKVSLLATILQDDVLVTSLRRLYLDPLSDQRDSGAALYETLRAYFGTGRNVSSAAAALGVSRQTISNRLRAVEEKLGWTLDSCAVELEMALRMESLNGQVGFEGGSLPISTKTKQHYDKAQSRPA